MNTQSMPTRALWIGPIPTSITSAQLLSIFSPFGPVKSARVLNHKSCGFINFERLEHAISALNTLNHQEILGIEAGIVRVGFAKVTSELLADNRERSPSPVSASLLSQSKQYPQSSSSAFEVHRPSAMPSKFMTTLRNQSAGGDEKSATVIGSVDEVEFLMRELSGNDDVARDLQISGGNDSFCSFLRN
jgi:RNA recognition motif-containing protein